PPVTGSWDYRVQVRSGVCEAVYSGMRTIEVEPAGAGGSVSGGTTPICLGESTGTLTLGGQTGSVVRWERRVDSGTWEHIANTSTTHSETPPSAGAWDYRALVQSGADQAYSGTRTILVSPPSVGGELGGGATPICLGESTGTLTLSGHTGSVLRWERRVDGGIWEPIANTTTTHSETPASAGAWDYRARVRSSPCAAENSSTRTISVSPLSVGGAVSGGMSPIGFHESTGTMTLSGHTGEVVRWQRRVDGGTWENIANTSTTHSEIPPSIGTWDYRARVQSSPCFAVFSSARTIVVGAGFTDGEAEIDGKHAPVAILLAREGGGGGAFWCPMGYQEVGRWQTGPGASDGGVEAIDFHGYKVDAGWAWICSADPVRVSVANVLDDCGSNTSTCSGQIRGRWHVGNGCTGGTRGVDGQGRSLQSGWMGLCVAAGTDAMVEAGHDDCGSDGPGCGAFRPMGHWHTNPTYCNGGDTGLGDSGFHLGTGWMYLCVDSRRFPPVDTSTLTGKVVTGYQGWFSAPGDGSQRDQWRHWFHGQDPSSAEANFDLWPDLSELGADERFVTDMQYTDGSDVALYSAYTAKTVNRHMRWMARYGIDAAFLQRYVCELSGASLEFRDRVAQNVMAGAEQHNRAFVVMYDITGSDPATLVDRLKSDWEYVVDDLGLTGSPAYLHHRGRPLVAVWGYGFTDRPGTAADVLELTDFFHNHPTQRYRATVMGGVPTYWRTGTHDSKPGFGTAYRSFDVISPWSVGRYRDEAGVSSFQTDLIQPDLVAAASAGADYMPVVWPGFSWANSHEDPGLFNSIPRNGGGFFLRQIAEAQLSGCTQLYVAMFDEVDESTAIFKAAASQAELPSSGLFMALDQDGYDLPNDWYLRLAGAGMKMQVGQIPVSTALPLK
ncbi:MAG: hypothetical protein JXR96_08895, partial [Deltaproteobacteria bacterium]|nr:hypothetical protein [Deltaproteobacteria bacterium]